MTSVGLVSTTAPQMCSCRWSCGTSRGWAIALGPLCPSDATVTPVPRTVRQPQGGAAVVPPLCHFTYGQSQVASEVLAVVSSKAPSKLKTVVKF